MKFKAGRVVRGAATAGLAAVLKPFVSADEVVSFQPRGPEDVAQAEQATEYVNYVINCDNPGFSLLHDWFKDALLTKIGVVKAWWTIHLGHDPPKRAKGKPAAASRLPTLPAGSTRRKKNGTPRCAASPGRCMVVRRWQACSKLTPKRAANASRSCRNSRAARRKGP